MIKKSVIVFISSLLFVGGVQAEPSDEIPSWSEMLGQASEPLTKKRVEQVYKSYDHLKEEFKDLEQDEGAQAWAGFFRANNSLTKVEDVVKKYGFESFADWYASFMQVIRAYTAYKSQGQYAQHKAQMDKQIAEINKNPNMTAEQKSYAINIMQKSSSVLQQLTNASQADMEAVKPYADKLEKMMQ